MAELLGCPMCGNDVNDDEGCFQVSGFRPPSTPAFAVRCGNPSCNAEVTATSRESAIAAWNRRTPPPQAAGGGPSKEWVEDAAHLIADMNEAGAVTANIAIAVYRTITPCAAPTKSDAVGEPAGYRYRVCPMHLRHLPWGAPCFAIVTEWGKPMPAPN